MCFYGLDITAIEAFVLASIAEVTRRHAVSLAELKIVLELQLRCATKKLTLPIL